MSGSRYQRPTPIFPLVRVWLLITLTCAVVAPTRSSAADRFCGGDECFCGYGDCTQLNAYWSVCDVICDEDCCPSAPPPCDRRCNCARECRPELRACASRQAPWPSMGAKVSKRAKRDCKRRILASCLGAPRGEIPPLCPRSPSGSRVRLEVAYERPASHLSKIEDMLPRGGFDFLVLRFDLHSDVAFQSGEFLLHWGNEFYRPIAPPVPGLVPMNRIYCTGETPSDSDQSFHCDLLFEVPSFTTVPDRARLHYRGTTIASDEEPISPVADAAADVGTIRRSGSLLPLIPLAVSAPTPKVTLHPRSVEVLPPVGSVAKFQICVEFAMWAHDGASTTAALLESSPEPCPGVGEYPLDCDKLALWFQHGGSSTQRADSKMTSLSCVGGLAVSSGEARDCRACFSVPPPITAGTFASLVFKRGGPLEELGGGRAYLGLERFELSPGVVTPVIEH